MLSDAGGGLARRRREIGYLSRSICSLSRSFFHFLIFYNPFFLRFNFHGSMHSNSNNEGFPVKLLSLVRTVPWSATLVKEEHHLSTRLPIAKFEICLLNIFRSMESRTFAILVAQCLYRIPSKSNLPPPCSSTEWISALTSEPVMMLTAEGLNLHLPSSPQIVSYPYGPYSCGCTFIVPSSAENLGFCLLLGLSYCCSPFFLPRPTSQILSPSPNHKRPRFNFYILFPSPIIKIYRSYALSLCSCLKTIVDIWRCEFLSQTLRLNSPMARVDKIISLKTIDELLFLKPPSRTRLVSLSGNQFRLSRHVHKATSLPVFILVNFIMKHPENESTQKAQSRDVNLLFLLQTSRIFTNWSQQISRLLFRTSLLHDLKGPWHPSALVSERTSVLSSSCMERNRSESLTASLWFVPAIREAKYSFSTSQNLLIVTIPKILELFAEVSLTHHNLVCGMLLDSLCFRVFMILSPKLIAYFSYMFVVRLCFKTLYLLSSPFWD